MSERYVIDCDADPPPPKTDKLRLLEHKRNGKIELVFGGKNLFLNGKRAWLDPENQARRQIQGEASWYFVREAMTKSDANANLLYFFLERPHLILPSWRPEFRHILFPGTRYVYTDQGQEIRMIPFLSVTRTQQHIGYCSYFYPNNRKGGDKLDMPAVLRVGR